MAQALNEPFLCLHIFSFLGPDDLARVSLVTHEWYSLSCSDILWRDLCRRHLVFDAWNEIKHLESPRDYLVNELLVQRRWRKGEMVVHSVPGFKVSHFRTVGSYIFGFSGISQQVYVWELFTGRLVGEKTQLLFNSTLTPKHLIPSLTLPICLQVYVKIFHPRL